MIQTKNGDQNICIHIGNYAQLVSEELTLQGVEHTFFEETKCLSYPASACTIVQSVHESLTGEPPPGGLNANWGSRNEALVSLLEANDIATTKYQYYGEEYVVWSVTDHKLADEVIGVESGKKAWYLDQRSETSLRSRCEK